MLALSGKIRRILNNGVVAVFRPSYQHTAFSATLLIALALTISRLFGYLRESYIAYAFGARAETDAYIAAFTFPDLLLYFLAGGWLTITITSLHSRYVSEHREAEAQKGFCVLITVMTAVLLFCIAGAEIFAPIIDRQLFPKFTAEQLRLCVHVTRILLPNKIFFYVGGALSAILMSQRRFFYPTFAPLLHNIFIILAGILLGKRYGIASLAWGALAGAFAGPFLINAVGAARAGVRYWPSFDYRNKAFREWLWLSIPLVFGVTVTTADTWFLRFFASGSVGDITRLHYAKRFFLVPVAILGGAAGQASLPFFARLFGQGRTETFESAVSNSIYRVTCVSLLIAAWMTATSLPVIDLVYRRGLFYFSDSRQTALYFLIFVFSLPFWIASGLYARAFYAAGDTKTPIIGGSIITVFSLAIYSLFFQWFGIMGLAIASDIAIVAYTLMLALFLHRRALVSLDALPWRDIAKVATTALIAGVVGSMTLHLFTINGSRKADVLSILVVSITWAVTVASGLWILRSEFLDTVLQRARYLRHVRKASTENELVVSSLSG